MKGNTGFSRFNTFAVVLVPLLWLFETSAVAPALGSIAQAFPKASMLQLQLVLTAPFITVFVFSIISGGLARYFDKKIIMIVGLIFYGVTGITPAFAGDITTILILRFLTGIGVGLILPLPNTIVAQNFHGEKRERLLGLNMAVANVGNVVIGLIVAALLVFGWQYSFYSFITVFLVLLFVIAGVPKSPPVKEDHAETKSEGKMEKPGPPGVIYALGLLMAFSWAAFGTFATNMSLFITTEKMGPVWIIGFVMAFPATGSIISGTFFPELNRIFKKYLMFIAFLVFGCGFLLLHSAHSVLSSIVGCLLVGLGSGIVPPAIFNITANRVSQVQKDFSFGVVTSCIHLGCFLTPFFQLGLSKIGDNYSIRYLFISTGIVLIITAVIALGNSIRTKTQTEVSDIERTATKG